jgi:hypothetical protein
MAQEGQGTTHVRYFDEHGEVTREVLELKLLSAKLDRIIVLLEQIAERSNPSSAPQE